MSEEIKGLEEDRAIFAYNCVIEASKDNKVAKEYKSYVKNTPMMIQNNGLGPAIAFIYSKKNNKKDNAYSLIYKAIEKRLIKIGLLEEGEILIKAILEKDSTAYRQITMETLALFSWLRRFVDGMIEGE